ncbi:terminase small subunit [Chryseobacterium sp.]|uniref:terminase small subunit n=1 Tax=Chryseobacterium sp. TaxID=1871047 RepID=UPI0028A28690|nr:terminase small subunit [Chryseobacterium sp.]
MMEGRDNKGQFAEGNKFSPGRTPVYSNGDELAEKLLEYFEWIKGEFIIERKITSKTTGKGKDTVTTTEDEPVKIWVRHPEEPTMTGLAIYLGFESRQSLYDYGKKDGFSYPIKRALLEVENNYEKGLFGDKVVGVIWGLKNMGWTDKTETKLSGDSENPITVNQITGMVVK